MKRFALLLMMSAGLSIPACAETTWVEVQCPVFSGIAGFFAPGYAGNTMVIITTTDRERSTTVTACLPDGTVVAQLARFDSRGRAVAWFVLGAHVISVR